VPVLIAALDEPADLGILVTVEKPIDRPSRSRTSHNDPFQLSSAPQNSLGVLS